MPANSAPFVYQCTELIEPTNKEEIDVCQFCIQSLKALGVAWGPTHTEIKISPLGPRIIEVNARWHGQNFVSIAQECIGYDAITLSLDSFYNSQGIFDCIPEIPRRLKKFGRIVHLISFKSGTICKISHIEKIKSLQSFHYLHFPHEVGDEIDYTKDIRTDAGYVLLKHSIQEILDADYRYILSIQPTLIEIVPKL